MNVGFAVPVAAGHVVQFARAIGLDVDDPAALVHPPPTFCMVADQFDPAFPRRPRPGEPWPAGIGETPADGQVPLHVGQRFDYHRPIMIGEVLRATRHEPKTWTKQGRRGGRLRFVDLRTSFVDAQGRPVVESSWVDVYTERAHRSLSTSDASTSVELKPAIEVESMTAGLSRTQIVMYVGAAGDFHPLHHDEAFAVEHGYPSVFAPGMLIMALAGRALGSYLEAHRWTRFVGKFHAQVWPGDALDARLLELSAASATVEMVTQTGRHVFTGTSMTLPCGVSPPATS